MESCTAQMESLSGSAVLERVEDVIALERKANWTRLVNVCLVDLMAESGNW